MTPETLPTETSKSSVKITCNVNDDKGQTASANTSVTITAPYVAPAARTCPEDGAKLDEKYCPTCSGKKLIGYECPVCKKEYPK